MNYRFVSDNLVYYSVLFNFGHIRRWDQCGVYILYSKISTDPGLLKIRHSHRFVAVVIQILILFVGQTHATCYAQQYWDVVLKCWNRLAGA